MIIDNNVDVEKLEIEVLLSFTDESIDTIGK
jgi:hypothetical protein